jgi:hypothetical protein
MQLVFLLEEASMKNVLDIILPKIIPENVAFLTIKHEGKSDLERSIPRKLRAFTNPETYFVILRDKDSSDCREVKRKLISLCEEGGRPDALVRIVCHELESWFLGDLSAVEKAFNKKNLSILQEKAKYRDPDQLANPAQELKKLVGEYQKLSGSREIAAHLSLLENRSYSFHVFLSGIKKLLAQRAI